VGQLFIPLLSGIIQPAHLHDEGSMAHTSRLKFVDNKMNVVGPRVKLRRQQMKVKQDGLCAMVADVTGGAWVPTWRDVQRIELGTRMVSDFEVIALAAALEVEIVFLLGGNEIGLSATKLLAQNTFLKAVCGERENLDEL